MNILFTSAGRRGYLIDYFKQVKCEKNVIYVGNSIPSSAQIHGDFSVITPTIYDDKYIPFLLEYCTKNSIDMLIPLFDMDAVILSRHKDEFKSIGTFVCVSDSNVVDICEDKWKTFEFANQHSINYPRSYLSLADTVAAINGNEIKYPIIVKPRWGMGSLGLYEAYDEIELRALTQMCLRKIENSYLTYEATVDFEHSIIYQEKLAGQEYGLDIINDFEGNYQTTVVRKKVAMRSGETDQAIVVKDERIEKFGLNLGHILSHIGNMDVDIFLSGDVIYLLELNPRFGGGYPFSHYSGINEPEAYCKWYRGDKLNKELCIDKYDEILEKEIGDIVSIYSNGEK